jgi:hypothetical protein
VVLKADPAAVGEYAWPMCDGSRCHARPVSPSSLGCRLHVGPRRMRSVDADGVAEEIKRQVRAIRAGGSQPAALELGDQPYARLRERTGRDFSRLYIREDGGLHWWFPGAPADEYSGDVWELRIRRLGPGDTVLVLAD